MSRRGPTDVRLWYDGFNFGAAGTISEASDNYQAHKTDVTPIGPKGAVRHSKPLGTAEYALSQQGWYDTDAPGLRNLIAADAAAGPHISLFGKAGDAVGAPVTLATDIPLDSWDVLNEQQDLTKLALAFSLNTGGAVYPEAKVFGAGLVEDVVDSGATYNAANRLDGGAQTTDGAVICIMADRIASRWRGYPTLTLQARHSNDGSSWANLGTALVLDRDDKGAVVLTVAGTVRRYVALRHTFSGTRDAFEAVGAFASGVKAISVDGGTGLERIEAGDRLSIGAGTYTVATAAKGTGAGRWDVTLTAGLAAALADNAAVSLTGSNVVVDRIGCLHRL